MKLIGRPFNPEAIRNNLRVGMSVSFGRKDGEQTDGVIVKINKRRVKVRTVNPRGTAPAGTDWNVPPEMITVREDVKFEAPTEKEQAILRIRKIMAEHGIRLVDLSEKK